MKNNEDRHNCNRWKVGDGEYMRHHLKLDGILGRAKNFLRDNGPGAKPKKSGCPSRRLVPAFAPPKPTKLDKAKLYYNIPEMAENKYGSAVIRSTKIGN